MINPWKHKQTVNEMKKENEKVCNIFFTSRINILTANQNLYIMSKQEIYAWTSFLSSLAVLGFYSITVYGWPDNLPDIESQLSSLFIKVFLFALGVEVLLGILKNKDEVEKDERDEMIAGKGFRNAYLFLSVVIAFILSQLILDDIFGRAGFMYGMVSLIHALFISLFVASMVNRITQIYFYRKV